MKKIFLFVFIIFFCCRKKGNNTAVSQSCDNYIKKFNQYLRDEKIDSALYYINEAIKCDPTKNEYKLKKVQYLISEQRYEMAYKSIDDFSNPSPEFIMMKGVIALKLNKNNSNKLLKEAYKEIQDKTKNVNNQYYKIALDNYFEGKDYALNQIKVYQKTYDKKYYIYISDLLEKHIKNLSKEEVLFKIFNVK